MGHGELTGEILPVFYVTDVSKSVEFYRDVLGFEFHHFWDYDKSKEVSEWAAADPPVYAEMAAGDQKSALHLAREPYELQVGGAIHYFHVRDVDAHRRAVAKWRGDPSALIERPWMRMFSVTDPDGHRLFFYSPPGKGEEKAG
jgi:catechol 2,3-dioxygenase-like lactoylglutathione lyase family enzyme